MVQVLNGENEPITTSVRVNIPMLGSSRFTKGKLTIVGDAGVGKSLFTAGVLERYEASYTTLREVPIQSETIAVDFHTITCEIDKDTNYRVLLWDTAGQERFRSLTPMYLRDAVGVILMFDVTNRVSFENVINFWLKFVYQNVAPNTPAILVANKIDLTERRAVFREEAEAFAQINNLLYAETTALINASLHGALATIMANMFYHQKCAGIPSNSTSTLTDVPQKKKCCNGGKQ